MAVSLFIPFSFSGGSFGAGDGEPVCKTLFTTALSGTTVEALRPTILAADLSTSWDFTGDMSSPGMMMVWPFVSLRADSVPPESLLSVADFRLCLYSA